MTTFQKTALGLILLSFVLLSTAYNVLQPMWEAPDEPAHFGFVRYVQIHHALPTGDSNAPARLDAWNPTAEYIQPPLYYLVLATLLKPIRLPPGAQFHQNPYVAWPGHPWREAVALHRTDEGWPYHGLSLFLHAGRLISTGFGLVTLLATFALVWTITNRANDAIFATAWLSWTPGFLLASTRLNNDAAAMATGALTLFMCSRLIVTTSHGCNQSHHTTDASKVERKNLASIRLALTFGQLPLADLAITSICLSVALLSKLDNVSLLPLVAVATGLTGWRSFQERRSASALLAPLLALALPIGTFATWWLDVGRTFETRMGTAAGSGVAQVWQLVVDTPPSRVFGAIFTWNATWWGGVGWGMLTLWPPLVYLALAVPFFGLALLGIASLADRSVWRGERAPRLTAALVIVSMAPLLYFTIARQALPTINLDANARYTLPFASAIALAMVLGARRGRFGRLRRPLALGYLAALLALTIATAAILLPDIPMPRIPARLARDESELTTPSLAHFSNGVDLVAATGLPEQLPAGATVPFLLHWRVDVNPAADFVVYTQLVDVLDQSKIVGSDEVPFRSVFPPHLWQTGEFVDEPRRMLVPSGLGPGVYALVVGAYTLNRNTPEPIGSVGKSLLAGGVEIRRWTDLPDAGGLSTAKPAEVHFGDDLTLRGYDLQPTAGKLNVSLYWEVERPLSRNLVVSLQLIGPSGQLVSQQDGPPVSGRLPTTDWPIDRIIRDDHLVNVPIRNDSLRPILVVYDRTSSKRLTVTVSGQASSDHLALAP